MRQEDALIPSNPPPPPPTTTSSRTAIPTASQTHRCTPLPSTGAQECGCYAIDGAVSLLLPGTAAMQPACACRKPVLRAARQLVIDPACVYVRARVHVRSSAQSVRICARGCLARVRHQAHSLLFNAFLQRAPSRVQSSKESFQPHFKQIKKHTFSDCTQSLNTHQTTMGDRRSPLSKLHFA